MRESEYKKILRKYDIMLGRAIRLAQEATSEFDKDKLVQAFELYEQYIDEYSSVLPWLMENFPEKFHRHE